MTYNDLVREFTENPRDLVTRPMTNKDGVWFHVFANNGKLFVSKAIEKEPKCSISKPRSLKESELEEIYMLYLMRKQGKAVSAKATSITRNHVYWYGIFAEMENRA